LLEAAEAPAALTSVTFGAGESVVTAHIGAQGNLAVRSLNLERLLLGHEGAIHGLALLPDGSALLSGGVDKSIRLWSLNDGKELRTYAGSTAAVTSVAVTPDGQKIIAGSEDKFARVWNANPPADAVAPLTPHLEILHAAPVRSLAASSDNLKLVTCGDDGVPAVWDLANGYLLQRFPAHKGAAYAVALAADNRTLVSGSGEGTVQGHTLAVIRTIAAHPNKANDFALLQAGAQAASVGDEGSLKLWNLADGSLVRETKASEAALVTVAARGDNQQLAAADAQGRLYLWNAAGEPTTQFKTSSPIHDLRYSTDNLKLVAACEESRLRFYNPLDGALLYELTTPQPVRRAVFTTDNARVLAADAAGGATLWKYASPTATRTLAGHGGRVYAASFSPDGKQIASASADQTVRIWDAATGAQVKQFSGHVGAVYALAYSADGAFLVSCGADNTVRLWDVLGGRQLKQLDMANTVYALAFHNDGRRVAAAGLDKTIRLIDAFTGAESVKFEGHKDFVYRVKFNAAGTRLLSCGYGGTVHLWDVAGKPLLTENLERVAHSADLAPDGSQIIVAGGDGSVTVLEVPANLR
jgi:WD40 repeat protein